MTNLGLLASKITDSYIATARIGSDRREILIYKVHILLENIYKFLVTLLVAIATNTVPEVLFVLFTVLLVKNCLGSIHLNSSELCLVVSLISIYTPVVLTTPVYYDTRIYILSYLLYVLALAIYAPSLRSQLKSVSAGLRKKHQRRGLALIVCGSALYFVSPLYYNLFVITFTVNILFVLPSLYNLKVVQKA